MKFENNSDAQIDLSMPVPYITFPILSRLPFIKHGFSTRLGGVSEGIFSSMNLGTDHGAIKDEPANIMENYRRMAEALKVDTKSFVVSRQVHKTNIRIVDENDLGKGVYIPTDYEEIDGLITNRPNITLVTKYADCVPLYFVDPMLHVIALSHSGWRGTVQKIGKITVDKMKKEFGCNPKDIIAVIGPSICEECYEVGEETAAEFNNSFPRVWENGILTQLDNGKYLCNLWAANREVLKEAGLQAENIHISGVCTSCNSELLFSHRRTKGQRGSLAAFLALSE